MKTSVSHPYLTCTYTKINFHCFLSPLYKLELALVAENVKLTSIPSHCGSPSCPTELLSGCHTQHQSGIFSALQPAGSHGPGAIRRAIHNRPKLLCQAPRLLIRSPQGCDWSNALDSKSTSAKQLISRVLSHECLCVTERASLCMRTYCHLLKSTLSETLSSIGVTPAPFSANEMFIPISSKSLELLPPTEPPFKIQIAEPSFLILYSSHV